MSALVGGGALQRLGRLVGVVLSQSRQPLGCRTGPFGTGSRSWMIRARRQRPNSAVRVVVVNSASSSSRSLLKCCGTSLILEREVIPCRHSAGHAKALVLWRKNCRDVTEQKINTVLEHLESATQGRADLGVSLE